MGRAVVVGFLVLSLSGCGPSEAVKRARFVSACQQASFTPQQCMFLLAMSEAATDDSSDSAVIAGAAMGLAATSGMGRR